MKQPTDTRTSARGVGTGKLPYTRPAIAEEEAYETCIVMGCTKSSPDFINGCGAGYKLSGAG